MGGVARIPLILKTIFTVTYFKSLVHAPVGMVKTSSCPWHFSQGFGKTGMHLLNFVIVNIGRIPKRWFLLQPSAYKFLFTESAHSGRKGKVIVEACLNHSIVASRKIMKNRGEWSSFYEEAFKYPDINQDVFGLMTLFNWRLNNS